MKKTLIFLFSFLVAGFLFGNKALAVCPLCTIAVGAGVGLSRWLGIDDTITGLWIGGLIVSLIIWTDGWLVKKNIHFWGRTVLVVIAYFALVIIPLFYSGIIGNPLNTLCFCHLDKLLFGIIVGSIAFWCGANWHYYLKEKNNGHVYFPFQKIVISILPLIILSVLYYFLTK